MYQSSGAYPLELFHPLKYHGHLLDLLPSSHGSASHGFWCTETNIFSLSTLEDLLLTCSVSWSRNHAFGETITQNNHPQEMINILIASVEAPDWTQTCPIFPRENN
jgi:hypothetical protein